MKGTSVDTYSKPELVRDSKFLLISEAFATIFGLGIVIILSREIGKEEFGLWVAIFSVFQITSIMNFGFPTLIVREVSRSPELLYRIMKKIRRIQTIFGLVTIPVSIGLSLFFYGSDIGGNNSLFLVGFAYVFTVLQQVNRAGLRALGEAAKEVSITLLDRGLVFFLFLYLSLIGEGQIQTYTSAYVLGPIIGFMVSFWFLNRFSAKSPIGEYDLLEVARDSAPFGIGLIARPFRDGGLRVILSFVGGFSLVAVFEIAWRAYSAGAAVTVAIRKSMLPSFSSASLNSEELKISLSNGYLISRWVVQLGVLVGAASSFLIPVLFTENFSQSQLVFLLLLPSWGLMSINSTWVVAVESLLVGSKFATMMLGQLFITIFAAITISIWDSLYGVIIAVFLGEIFVFVTAYAMVRKNTSFHVEISNLFSFISTFFTFLAGYSIAVYLNEISFFSLVAVAHLIWMWWTKWRPEIPDVGKNQDISEVRGNT